MGRSRRRLPPIELERMTLGPLPALAAGEGPPLLYLGGLLPVAGVEASLVRRSAELSVRPFTDGRRVIYTNRRPGLPEGMTFAEIASEHAAAIVALDRGPVDVLGVSTGGSIAQQLAADRPETVRRLVLASTGCRLSAETRGVQARVAQDVREGKRNEAVAAMALGVAVPGGESLARLLAPLTAPLARRVGDLSDLATTIEAEETFDLARCERAVTAPTLIVAGARDRFYGAELLEETQRLIPGSVLLRIPRRGHMTVMADSRLIEAVRGHLDGGDARRGAEPIAAGR